MKWAEFSCDNGDGSYSKWRFATVEEAEAALKWLEENLSWWQGDGEGVSEVDTDSGHFMNTLESVKRDYD